MLGPPTTYLDQGTSNSVTQSGNYEIVLVDFGKATRLKNRQRLFLSTKDKLDYQKKFPQVAPEVINGDYRQSTYSDMYAVGGVLYQLVECSHISDKSYQKFLLNIAENCRLANYFKRTSASQALLWLQENVMVHQ